MSAEEKEVPKEGIQLDENKEECNQETLGNNEVNYKELYYKHPSQKDKIKKDFTEYSRVDMTLLNKKRERKEDEKNNENNNKLKEDSKINNDNKDNEKDAQEKQQEEVKNEKNEEKKNNIDNKDEEIKENDLENNLPKELLELIEQRKDKEPFTAQDFEKYKAFKKLDINFSK